MIEKTSNPRGFTLVERMIVIVIVSILPALAVRGLREYNANGKAADARNLLGQMSKDASAVFSVDSPGSTRRRSRPLSPTDAGALTALRIRGPRPCCLPMLARLCIAVSVMNGMRTLPGRGECATRKSQMESQNWKVAIAKRYQRTAR
jgi:prepilin-type N-terminal cleavage/methylation domain-containing protein